MKTEQELRKLLFLVEDKLRVEATKSIGRCYRSDGDSDYHMVTSVEWRNGMPEYHTTNLYLGDEFASVASERIIHGVSRMQEISKEEFLEKLNTVLARVLGSIL
jgi:hypothetical protein